jgi:hypothetical protein
MPIETHQIIKRAIYKSFFTSAGGHNGNLAGILRLARDIREWEYSIKLLM